MLTTPCAPVSPPPGARAQNFTWRSTGRNLIDYCHALAAKRAARGGAQTRGLALENRR